MCRARPSMYEKLESVRLSPFSRRERRDSAMLLILDVTRDARAAILRKFSNMHIIVSRYVAGVITVNSLIYDIPCIISRDFMRREFRVRAARKLVPLQMKRDKFGCSVTPPRRYVLTRRVCANTRAHTWKRRGRIRDAESECSQ